MTENPYLIITTTQLVVKDEHEVVKFLKIQQPTWEPLSKEEFQRLIDTGVGTFRSEHGATSVRILQVQPDGENKAIDKPMEVK